MQEKEGGDLKRVLYAEDGEVFRKTLKQNIYHTLGDKVEIVEARDGFEALEILAEGGVDLLISDINMPHVTGYVLAALRWMQFNPYEDLSSLGINEYAQREIADAKESIKLLQEGGTGILDRVKDVDLYRIPLIAVTAEYVPLRLYFLNSIGVDEVVRKDRDLSEVGSLVKKYIGQTVTSEPIHSAYKVDGRIIRLAADGSRESYFIMPKHGEGDICNLWSHLLSSEITQKLILLGAKEIQTEVDQVGVGVKHEVSVPNNSPNTVQSFMNAGYQKGPRGRLYRKFNPRRSS